MNRFNNVDALDRKNRIRHEILSIPTISVDIRKKILILPKNANQILIKFRHFYEDLGLDKYQELIIQFPMQYPLHPPIITSANKYIGEQQINSIFLQSELIDPKNWNPQTSLIDILLDIYKFIDNYRISEYAFKKSQFEMTKIQSQEHSPINVGAKTDIMPNESLFLKDCTQNQNSETKNLNRHFRSKLRQIYKETKDKLPHQQINSIEQTFKGTQIGFEEIKKLLKNQEFHKQVQSQINSGKFLGKIIKGVMGIRSKKLMLKYYHIMLSAIYEPDSFNCWKIESQKYSSQNQNNSEYNQQEEKEGSINEAEMQESDDNSMDQEN